MYFARLKYKNPKHSNALNEHFFAFQHLHIDTIHRGWEIVVYVVESVASRSTNCSHLDTKIRLDQDKLKHLVAITIMIPRINHCWEYSKF